MTLLERVTLTSLNILGWILIAYGICTLMHRTDTQDTQVSSMESMKADEKADETSIISLVCGVVSLGLVIGYIMITK
jgi:hypothetical protein